MSLHHAVLALLAAKPAHGYELNRVVHHLTPAGHAELNRWLSEPSPRIRGYRDDFFLKVMAAVQAADPATLAGGLHRQRAHLLRELHSLADARTLTARSAVDSLLITAAELHVRADLGVVDAAEKNLGQICSLRCRPGQSRARRAGPQPNRRPADQPAGCPESGEQRADPLAAVLADVVS